MQYCTYKMRCSVIALLTCEVLGTYLPDLTRPGPDKCVPARCSFEVLPTKFGAGAQRFSLATAKALLQGKTVGVPH